MLRKTVVLAAIVSLFVVLAVGPAFAAKPPRNDAPVVTQFDVEPASASPVPILTFLAEDNDGSVVGYLVTESSSEPSASDPDWSPTAPTSYTTASVGLVTLYAWAKDNEDAVSASMSDTVNIPDPQDQIIADLQARVAALEDLLLHFSRNGNDVVITGANLNVVSGTGATDGPVNGLGNLVLGYNEMRFTTPDRTGSHNLILGLDNNFLSYAGIVGGDQNSIIGPFTSVLGGLENTAGADYSVIVGGRVNETYVPGAGYAFGSSILGGYGNRTRGQLATVSGGRTNSAYGDMSSISGGLSRETAFYASFDWVAGSLWEDQ